MLRTHTCGQLNKKDVSQVVELAGWVHRRRDHGGVIFIDLRDRYGLTQVKFDPKINKKVHHQAEALRTEWVIKVNGKVKPRPEGMINKKLKTGEIEVEVEKLEILSKAKTLPFEIDEEKAKVMKEETKMAYRYLDLRKHEVMGVMIKRYEFIKFIRDYLHKLNFVEVETPVLGKSTPEGARDFLVPSRLQPGQFYALPQSPQQYKQLLMIAGLDKYFQIARCFRDEDTRGDRQAEFTQLDLEMSFVETDDILDLTQDLFTRAVEELFPEKEILFKPWPRLDYDEVMLKYGIDKPDLRFGLEIQDISKLVKNCGFKVFTEAVQKGGVVRAICASGAAKFSRAQIDALVESVKDYGAKGLAYIIIDPASAKAMAGRPSDAKAMAGRPSDAKAMAGRQNNLKSPIIKFLGEDLAKKIIKQVGGNPGDIIFFCADEKKIVCESLGQLRLDLGKRLNLIDPKAIAFAFIVNFPLFEEEMEDGHYAPSHHMFTSPRREDIKLLDKDPVKVKSYQYDMVGNGVELGGGSIRIHDRKLQEKIFTLIGFDEKRREQFSHFLRAFAFGVPPHGGIAPGIDRILMVLMDKLSIRDVMAFPKTGDGRDLMMEAPSEVEEGQLKELGLKLRKVQ